MKKIDKFSKFFMLSFDNLPKEKTWNGYKVKSKIGKKNLMANLKKPTI